jgi:hypothetical protein
MEFALSQFDIMECIGKEVNNVREREKNKQKYNIVIKHLYQYLDEFQRFPMDEGAERAKDSDFTYTQYLDGLSRDDLNGSRAHHSSPMTEDQFNEAMAYKNSQNRWKTDPWGCLPSGPDLRCDTRFLEHNYNDELYREYLPIILKSHNMNEEEYEEWCDDYF